MNCTFPLWLIPLFPLLGAIANGLLALAGAQSPKGPAKGFVSLIAVLSPLLSFVAVILAAVALEDQHSALEQSLWGWFQTSDLNLSFGLLFDRLTSMMLLFVTGIGTLIHLYSVGYMWEDRGYARFMAYMNLFMFSMIMLVLGASLPVTFLGWEGVGLCSYLLIGFWHATTEYNDAARKAFIMNRIGDLGFLLGAFALLHVTSSLDYTGITQWFANPTNLHLLVDSNAHWLAVAGLCIFIGCTGKSAQIPLLTWLPDAMAGPTPVSALIHAATMVTSGVYLLARLFPLYSHCAPAVLTTVLVVGTLTAVYGAVAGLFQNDIKKAFAYSTVSQLGYMFMASGVGANEAALFHVLTHAFFKATLFLGAGAIIYSLHHEQDMRKMGNLQNLVVKGRKPLAFVHLVLCLAWWAILGLPFGSGFYSKDLIMEKVFDAHAMVGSVNIAAIAGVIALLTAGLTAVYMSRVMYLTFWSPSRVSEETKHHVKGTPITMAVPLIILAFGSMGAGYLWVPFLQRFDLLRTYLDPVLDPVHAAQEVAVVSSGGIMQLVPDDTSGGIIISLVALLLVGAGIIAAYKLYHKGPTGPTVAEQPSSDPTGFGASWTWAFDRVYDWLVVMPVRILSHLIYALVEWALIPGITWLLVESSFFLGDGYASAQRSRLRSSLFWSVLGLAAVIYIAPLAVGVNYCAHLVQAAATLIHKMIY